MPKRMLVSWNGIGKNKTFTIALGTKLTRLGEDKLGAAINEAFLGTSHTITKDGDVILRRNNYPTKLWLLATPEAIEVYFKKTLNKLKLI